MQEVGNVKDGYAISVLQGSDEVGHLPQMISRINEVAAGISCDTF